MKLDEIKAVNIALKVIADIEYNDDTEEPNVKFFVDELMPFENVWMVSFPYGAEDYGINETGESMADMHILISDESGIASNIFLRNSSVILVYNEKKDKYTIKERRP